MMIKTFNANISAAKLGSITSKKLQSLPSQVSSASINYAPPKTTLIPFVPSTFEVSPKISNQTSEPLSLRSDNLIYEKQLGVTSPKVVGIFEFKKLFETINKQQFETAEGYYSDYNFQISQLYQQALESITGTSNSNNTIRTNYIENIDNEFMGSVDRLVQSLTRLLLIFSNIESAKNKIGKNFQPKGTIHSVLGSLCGFSGGEISAQTFTKMWLQLLSDVKAASMLYYSKVASHNKINSDPYIINNTSYNYALDVIQKIENIANFYGDRTKYTNGVLNIGTLDTIFDDLSVLVDNKDKSTGNRFGLLFDFFARDIHYSSNKLSSISTASAASVNNFDSFADVFGSVINDIIDLPLETINNSSTLDFIARFFSADGTTRILTFETNAYGKQQNFKEISAVPGSDTLFDNFFTPTIHLDGQLNVELVNYYNSVFSPITGQQTTVDQVVGDVYPKLKIIFDNYAYLNVSAAVEEKFKKLKGLIPNSIDLLITAVKSPTNDIKKQIFERLVGLNYQNLFSAIPQQSASSGTQNSSKLDISPLITNKIDVYAATTSAYIVPPPVGAGQKFDDELTQIAIMLRSFFSEQKGEYNSFVNLNNERRAFYSGLPIIVHYALIFELFCHFLAENSALPEPDEYLLNLSNAVGAITKLLSDVNNNLFSANNPDSLRTLAGSLRSDEDLDIIYSLNENSALDFLTPQQIMLSLSQLLDYQKTLKNDSGTVKIVDTSYLSIKSKNALTCVSQNAPISNLNSNIRRHIITVGIKPKTLNKLKFDDKSSLSRVPDNDLFYIVFNRLDLENPSIAFVPKKFLFQSSRFVAKYRAGVSPVNSSVADIVEQYDFMRDKNLGYTNYSIPGTSTSYFGKNISSSEADELITNNVLSYVLEAYVKSMTGISVNEMSFMDVAKRSPGSKLKIGATGLELLDYQAAFFLENIVSTFINNTSTLQFLRSVILRPKDYDRVFNVVIGEDDFVIDEQKTVDNDPNVLKKMNQRLVQIDKSLFLINQEESLTQYFVSFEAYKGSKQPQPLYTSTPDRIATAFTTQLTG